VTLFPSSGAIHYLWWYKQGSIMDPGVRKRLRNAWGFCERHAWVALLVESASRLSFYDSALYIPSLIHKESYAIEYP